MAVDGIKGGRQHTSKTHLGNLWTQIWDEYETCVQGGISITVLKVKSHDIDVNIDPVELKRRNKSEDTHAGEAGI